MNKKKETLPPAMNTMTKRREIARALAEKKSGVKTRKESERPYFQGYWSETHIFTLKNHTEVVIQLRAEPLDIAPFARARKLLGEYVPIIELLHDEELRTADLWPVCMSRIEGKAWADKSNKIDARFNVTAMKSLGKLLARCVMDEKSARPIQDDIIAKLDKRLALSRKEVRPFRTIIQDLKVQVETGDLQKLPLFCSHMDLNQMNIMVREDGQVTGIVDWELSPPPQPFGMGLHRIHDLAGEFRNVIYYEHENYEDMERSFWSELMDALPVDVRKRVNNNLPAVQTSITIGTILWAFDTENLDLDKLDESKGEGIGAAILGALPKFLTYRIPALRGDDPPYANPPYPGGDTETT